MVYMIDKPGNTADKMVRVAPHQMPAQVQPQPAVSPLVAELQEKLRVAQARVAQYTVEGGQHMRSAYVAHAADIERQIDKALGRRSAKATADLLRAGELRKSAASMRDPQMARLYKSAASALEQGVLDSEK